MLMVCFGGLKITIYLTAKKGKEKEFERDWKDAVILREGGLTLPTFEEVCIPYVFLFRNKERTTAIEGNIDVGSTVILMRAEYQKYENMGIPIPYDPYFIVHRNVTLRTGFGMDIYRESVEEIAEMILNEMRSREDRITGLITNRTINTMLASLRKYADVMLEKSAAINGNEVIKRNVEKRWFDREWIDHLAEEDAGI